MDLQVHVDSDCAWVVVPADVLGIQDILSVSNELVGLLDSGHASLLLDLRKSEYIAGSFCGFLVSVATKAREAGAHFSVLVDPESESFKTLQTLGMHEAVDFHLQLSTAMKVKPGGKSDSNRPS